MNRPRFAAVATGVVILSMVGAGLASAAEPRRDPSVKARDDAYRVRPGATLTVGGDGVLGNRPTSPLCGSSRSTFARAPRTNTSICSTTRRRTAGPSARSPR
ncbi:MAG: hypothetical protein ACQSGP_18040 [Frankia sp.]